MFYIAMYKDKHTSGVYANLDFLLRGERGAGPYFAILQSQNKADLNDKVKEFLRNMR